MQCSACTHVIEEKDNYCSECGYSLNKSASAIGALEIPTLDPIRSYPERLLRFSPLSYWLSYAIVWEVILLADYMICQYNNSEAANLPLMASLVGFFIFTCSSIVYCSRKLQSFFSSLASFLDVPLQELKSWYTDRLKNAYASKKSMLFSLVFSIGATVSIQGMIKSLSLGNDTIFYYRISYISIGFFFVGLGIWAIWMIVKLASEISKHKVKIAVYQNPRNSVLALGTVFLKMSFSIALTYAMIVLTAALSPYGGSWIVWSWMIFAALAVLAFFIIPQYGVHKIMSREKQQRLMAFSSHLEKSMEISLHNPTQENMQRLRELFELQQHLHKMNEWPFNYNALWQLLTALLIPILLAMADILWKGK